MGEPNQNNSDKNNPANGGVWVQLTKNYNDKKSF